MTLTTSIPYWVICTVNNGINFYFSVVFLFHLFLCFSILFLCFYFYFFYSCYYFPLLFISLIFFFYYIISLYLHQLKCMNVACCKVKLFLFCNEISFFFLNEMLFHENYFNNFKYLLLFQIQSTNLFKSTIIFLPN